ncbi:hypothetical protein [Dehalogenimonas alkenigignens]|uniref:hypothetical protein n=1 Tax=Dehalogenimonas alkenigignens TaxID=1217799 RepID=UPI000D57B339|nr:hypothetical protein [Dehalogenimonas alkenigignens]PVV83516.1 hypothetical protein DD509_06715 [Dehalogenimonas alkenigignens]
MNRWLPVFGGIFALILLAAFFPELTAALQTLLGDPNIGDYTMFETFLGWTPVALWGAGLGVVVFMAYRNLKGGAGGGGRSKKLR